MNAYGMARAPCTFSGSVKAAIHAFKYQSKTYLAGTLIDLMERGPLLFDIGQYDRLVPVPLHRKRLRQRGYNQSLLLAREIGRPSGIPVDGALLKRIRDSVPQVDLMGAKREANVKGVFSVEGKAKGQRLLLVDDVLTTGATVNECARVLIRAGARRVDILTVARAV
jgi:ComF family protein